MSKRPIIERCPTTGGLTGQSAYEWAVFLAEEADFDDDPLLFDRFSSIAETLKPSKGKPGAHSFHCKDLEDAIKVYHRRKV